MKRDYHETQQHDVVPARHTAWWARTLRVAAFAVLASALFVGASASRHTARAASLAVVSASASVAPTSFSGVCSPTMTFDLNATLTLNAGNTGGTVTYFWLVDSGTVANGSANVAAGQVSLPLQPYAYHMDAASGTGATHTAQLDVYGPNSVFSNGAPFSLTCLTVSSVTLSGAGSCYFGLRYTGTIAIAPSPAAWISYSWQFVNNANVSSSAMGPSSIYLPADSTTPISVSYGSPFPYRVPPGTYGAILVVVTPNMVYSNPVIRTC